VVTYDLAAVERGVTHGKTNARVLALFGGLFLMVFSGRFARKATGQRNIFGQMNEENPGVARVMPLIVGGCMVVAGVLALFGVIGVQ
jgi:hypothetical protein